MINFSAKIVCPRQWEILVLSNGGSLFPIGAGSRNGDEQVAGYAGIYFAPLHRQPAAYSLQTAGSGFLPAWVPAILFCG